VAQGQAGLGDYETAVTTAEQALDVARQTRLRLLEGHAHVALASISLDSGRRAGTRGGGSRRPSGDRPCARTVARAERLLELLDEA
jgi:hypothetical protein